MARKYTGECNNSTGQCSFGRPELDELVGTRWYATVLAIVASVSGLLGGLDFPGTDHPDLTEFLYFSFTIGTSFAVSDVDVRTAPMRRRVMVHSVIGFLFNAALPAVAVDRLKS